MVLRQFQDQVLTRSFSSLIRFFSIAVTWLSAGLREKVLADIFHVNTIVSRDSITWEQLFCTIFCDPCLYGWQKIKSGQPCQQIFRSTAQLSDCTEIRCENPTALTLKSEMGLGKVFPNLDSTRKSVWRYGSLRLFCSPCEIWHVYQFSGILE